MLSLAVESIAVAQVQTEEELKLLGEMSVENSHKLQI